MRLGRREAQWFMKILLWMQKGWETIDKEMEAIGFKTS